MDYGQDLAHNAYPLREHVYWYNLQDQTIADTR